MQIIASSIVSGIVASFMFYVLMIMMKSKFKIAH